MQHKDTVDYNCLNTFSHLKQVCKYLQIMIQTVHVAFQFHMSKGHDSQLVISVLYQEKKNAFLEAIFG